MTDAPNAETFDLGAFLAGVNYPTDEVEVFFAEDVAYALNKVNSAIKRAEILEDADALRELEGKRDELINAGLASRLVIHIQGISRRTEKDINAKVMSEYPVETNLIGTVKPNPERAEALANLFWAAYITQIEAPNGSVLTAPGLEDIKRLRDTAPESAIETIESAINGLTTGAKGGFESLAQEHGFLSQPSPEA